ncbi:hypothetical protein WDZ16_00060 [Pseudokineococcus marinus]|uniref:Uncharacterized protein n=1 Tax=Pseudokineococcus marinus TaxID=351215 RepID=A0A849BMV0_9ACTN|nr:hypothetical protein [Pseudokineococcus marinus]NNH22112.1 hypothetical protein [Pseudokineococcus marinus]
MGTTTQHDQDDAGLDPREALALLDAERTRTQQRLVPDLRLLYGTWGVAWLVGFLVLWGSTTGRGPLALPPAAGGVVFAGLLVAAVVVTGVHIARRTAGVRGASSTQGAMYGWAWLLGFGCMASVMASAAGAGASPDVLGVLGPAVSGLVVGLLYLGGGAMWQDRAQYSLGVWILLSSAVGALAGHPSNHLVMGLLGGGGFLVAALVVAARGPRAGAPA